MALLNTDLFSVSKSRLLLKWDQIKMSCSRVSINKFHLALVVSSKSTDSDEIHLLMKENQSVEYKRKKLKWIPDKTILAIDFSPDGEWLLVITETGRICIIPISFVFGQFQAFGNSWNRSDMTYLKIKLPKNSASCVQWWKTFSSQQIGLVGCTAGNIIMLDLVSGKRLYATRVQSNIARIDLVQTNDNNSTYCLITSKVGNQWKLLLEEKESMRNRADTEDQMWGYEGVDIHNVSSFNIIDKGNKRRASDLQMSGFFEPTKLYRFPQSVILRYHYFPPKHFVSAYHTSTGKLEIFDPSNFEVPLYVYSLPRGALDICLTDRLIIVAFSTNNTLAKLPHNDFTSIYKTFTSRLMSTLTEGIGVSDKVDNVAAAAASAASAVAVVDHENDSNFVIKATPTYRIQIKIVTFCRQHCQEDDRLNNYQQLEKKLTKEINFGLEDKCIQCVDFITMQTEMSVMDTLKFYCGNGSALRLHYALNQNHLTEELTNSKQVIHPITQTFHQNGILNRWNLDKNCIQLMPDFIVVGEIVDQPIVLHQKECLEDICLRYLIDEGDAKLAEWLGVGLRLDMNYLYESAAHYLCQYGTVNNNNNNSKDGTNLRTDKIDRRNTQYKNQCLILDYFDMARTPMQRRFQSLDKYWTSNECLRYILQLLRRPDDLSPSERKYLASSAMPIFAKVLSDTMDQPEEHSLLNNKFQHFVMNNFLYDEEEAIHVLLKYGLIKEALFVAKERNCVLHLYQCLVNSQWTCFLEINCENEEMKHFFHRENTNELCSGIDFASLSVVLRSDLKLFLGVVLSIRQIIPRLDRKNLAFLCSLLTPMRSQTSVVQPLFISLSKDWQQNQNFLTNVRGTGGGSGIGGGGGSALESSEKLSTVPLLTNSISQVYGRNNIDKMLTLSKEEKLALSDADLNKKKVFANESFITFMVMYLQLIAMKEQECSSRISTEKMDEKYLYYLPNPLNSIHFNKIESLSLTEGAYGLALREFQLTAKPIDINKHVMVSCVKTKVDKQVLNKDNSEPIKGSVVFVGLETEWNIHYETPLLKRCCITSVSLGQQHALFMDSHGKVYSAGMNQFGQLGIDPIVESQSMWSNPLQSHDRRGSRAGIQRIKLPFPAVHICAGAYHSGAILWTKSNDNQKFCVMTWGWSVYGQLALPGSSWGERDFVPNPTDCRQMDWMEPDEHAVALAMGINHTLFLTNKGHVYGCGGNNLQQLGPDEQIKILQPIQLKFLQEKVRAVSTKFYQSSCITESGSVIIWGEDVSSQSMFMRFSRQPNSSNESTASDVGSLKEIKDILDLHPQEILTQVACGMNHSLLLSNEGRVFSVGMNYNGQCGLGHTKNVLNSVHLIRNLPRIQSISADECVSLAVDCHGQLYYWGLGSHRVVDKIFNKIQKDFNEPKHLLETQIYGYTGDNAREIEELSSDSTTDIYTRRNLYYCLTECVPYLDHVSILNTIKQHHETSCLADIFLILERLPQSLHWRLKKFEEDFGDEEISSTLLMFLSETIDFYLNDILKYPADKAGLLSIIISFYHRKNLPMTHLTNLLNPSIDSFVGELVNILSRPGLSESFPVSFLVSVLQSWHRAAFASPTFLSRNVDQIGLLKEELKSICVKLESTDSLKADEMDSSGGDSSDNKVKPRSQLSLYGTTEHKRLVVFACGHRTTFHQLRDFDLPTLLDRLRKQNLTLSVQFVQKMFMQDNRLPSCIVCLLKDTVSL